MHISRLRIKNWRNFKEAEIKNISDVVYILGPNASGKSNVLDAIRFLRDLSRSKGGGLQEAIDTREGIAKIRCLHARKDTEILIDVDISNDEEKVWSYEVGFNLPSSGFQDTRRPIVTKEIVTSYSNGRSKIILERPNKEDDEDIFLLQQTHLEQISLNRQFRDLADFFGATTYSHLVPQLLKFGDAISGRTIDNDPFGQEFLIKVARTPERTRVSRLKKIEKALQRIVPQMEDLQFLPDEVTGRPHLEIRFKHHRPRGARQREDQFSDGTLRLISLFWLLQEPAGSPLLLEEPELSLNEEIVKQLSYLIDRVSKRKDGTRSRQIFITTHSYALLSNPGIDPNGIAIITPSTDGSTMRKTNSQENAALAAGLSPAEVVLPQVRKLASNFQLTLDI